MKKRWFRRPVNLYKRAEYLFLPSLLLTGFWMHAQMLSPKELKKLPIEDLMNVEVSLVSRTPEKLTEAASAVQVITNEDIHRSGASNVAEALRLVTNLQVAQLSSSVWIISARGFNNVFSNKLLVMIDGRTVYTPLYGGVLWEQQIVPLEDIDRIEMVSGPGGTLWGANAVNGIINIVTKNTKLTQGLYASAAAGNFIKDMIDLRYGGQINENLTYKIYGQHFDRGATELPNGTKNTDEWKMNQVGLRMDWNLSKKDALVLDGAYYDGNRATAGNNSPLNGQHILARWSSIFSDRSDMAVQVYYDRYYRADAPTTSYDKMQTIDADFQHRLGLSRVNNFVWGLGYRYVQDDAYFINLAGAGILPRFKRLDLFNAFVQDEITLASSLKLTLGTKLLHNVYTDWEWQPSARIAWSKPKSTLWAAATRAVRTPSRFDVDYYLPMTPQPPNVPSVAGGPNFISEKLVAYELGYRFQPNAVSSFSIATFYNRYKDVYTVEALPNTVTYQIQNNAKAQSWGAELMVNYQVTKDWRLRGGYTFFRKDIAALEGHNFNPEYLGNDVQHQVLVHSILDLPFHFQLDITGRYLDSLPKTFATARVPSYLTMDARLAYSTKGFEVAVVGQNLKEEKHAEFGTVTIPRSYYVRLSARF